MAYDPNLSKDFTSEFNEAAFQMQRLHNLWLMVNLHRSKGNYQLWNVHLDGVYLELSADSHVMDKDKYEKEFIEHKDKIEACQNDKAKMYWALFEKEKFIRLLEFEVGKGSKHRDKNEDEEFD